MKPPVTDGHGRKALNVVEESDYFKVSLYKDFDEDVDNIINMFSDLSSEELSQKSNSQGHVSSFFSPSSTKTIGTLVSKDLCSEMTEPVIYFM